jgi:hypothetical protein
VKTICILGHSHGHMLRWAMDIKESNIDYEYEAPIIGTKEMLGGEAYTLDDKHMLNANIETELSKFTDITKGSVHLLTAFAGNGCNQFYMIEDNEPYDFIYESEEPDEQFLFVSKEMVKAALKKYLVNTKNALTILMQKGFGSVSCLQVPPPNPSNEFMMDKLRKVNDDLPYDHKISSNKLRLKLWLTMDSMYREMCDELGVLYVCAPESTRDENGFLLEIFWKDTVHANYKYGTIILEEHQKLINNLN